MKTKCPRPLDDGAVTAQVCEGILTEFPYFVLTITNKNPFDIIAGGWLLQLARSEWFFLLLCRTRQLGGSLSLLITGEGVTPTISGILSSLTGFLVYRCRRTKSCISRLFEAASLNRQTNLGQ